MAHDAIGFSPSVDSHFCPQIHDDVIPFHHKNVNLWASLNRKQDLVQTDS